MNRPLFCIILLLTIFPFTGQIVLAEKLYRWVEPDGSITFSPNPPPAGTDYKAVNAAHNNAATEDLPELEQKPSILATSEHSLDTPEPTNNPSEIVAQPALAEEAERQKLSYAPDIGSNNTTTLPINAVAPTTNQRPNTGVAPETNQTMVTQTNSAANSKKRRQCQDLNKRVLSLERRLRSPLKPEDMDNTVIAMARYQRSYDQHCVE